MLKTKEAFTLSEVLVTLAILGILASVILPIVGKARPNKNKALFKKAYYVAERIVYELVNDEDLYPTSVNYHGFDNVEDVIFMDTEYGSKTDTTKQKKKFCSLFARKVNTTSDKIYCDSKHDAFTEAPSFITTDGIAWHMPYTNSDADRIIRVDVNGGKSPNCTYNSTTCPNPDRFEIKVKVDGKMYVTGTKEKEYLQSNDSLR